MRGASSRRRSEPSRDRPASPSVRTGRPGRRLRKGRDPGLGARPVPADRDHERPGRHAQASAPMRSMTTGRAGGRRFRRCGRRGGAGRPRPRRRSRCGPARCRAAVRRAPTGVPTGARVSKPTLPSIFSPGRVRPPPSPTTATPTRRVSMAETKPRASASTSRLTGAPGQIGARPLQQVFRAALPAPPWRRTVRPRGLSGAPFSISRRPLGRVPGEAAEDECFAAERVDDGLDARIEELALEHAQRMAHFDGIAGRVGERLVHVGHEGRCRQARAACDLDDRTRERTGIVEPRHEGARAGLHVHHQRVETGGVLLRQDRGGDQWDRLDRRGDVAHGRRASRRRGRDRRSRRRSRSRPRAPPPGPPAPSAPCGSPGSPSSLSSVPPVWPRPRPEIIGTNAPQAASAGARTRLMWSPTPPVECLSSTGPPRSAARQSSTVPESVMARVRATVLGAIHAAQEHRHRESRGLLAANRAISETRHEALDLLGGERRAVALAAD